VTAGQVQLSRLRSAAAALEHETAAKSLKAKPKPNPNTNQKTKPNIKAKFCVCQFPSRDTLSPDWYGSHLLQATLAMRKVSGYLVFIGGKDRGERQNNKAHGIAHSRPQRKVVCCLHWGRCFALMLLLFLALNLNNSVAPRNTVHQKSTGVAKCSPKMGKCKML